MSEGPELSQSARIAVLSQRNFENHVSRSHGYEFEDAICQSLDDVDLFAPSAGPFFKHLSKIKNRASYQTVHAASMPMGLSRQKFEQDYDLFFYTIAHLRDLNALSALPEWRERSRVAICWIQELWIHDFGRQGALLDRLNEFDFVICSFAGTSEALARRIDTPVLFIPWGLDAEAFCPYPNPPGRAIDVLSIGVKHDDTHAALLAHAAETGSYYSYDTISGRAVMQDYKAHRYNYVSQIQRCKYFFSYIAKIDRTIERGDQVEFGLRYLEGMAAGAVVLGSKIDSEAFEKHLDWPDSVIDVPYACPEIGAVINDLEAQPERLEMIRKRNIIECLTRHDHLHRWEKILELAGMRSTSQMKARKELLDGLVRQVKKGETRLEKVG